MNTQGGQATASPVKPPPVKRRRRQSNHRWTEEDLIIVRRDYRGTRKSAQEIGDRIGASGNGVMAQALKMGLSSRPDRKPWSPEEDDRLRTLLEKMNPSKAAKKMGRTINSVTVRARRIHASRRVRDGWYTKREVCQILGVDHHWVQARIDAGSLRATHHHEQPPKKDGAAAWHIKAKDVRDFIRRHPEELTGRNVDLPAVVEILCGVNGAGPDPARQEADAE